VKIIQSVSWYFLFIVAFALGMKQIHEPDLWWMFKTGEWMVLNGQIPTSDSFSFTLKGTEWISVKWVFELIAYAFAQVTGPESIGVLQGMVNVALVYLFTKTTAQLTEILSGTKISKSHPLLIIAALFFLFSIDYRLAGRPEIFSHLLTLLFLSIFTQYKLKPGKFIYWLIPLQIIWVNIHEGFAVGIILLASFGVGYAFDNWILKNSNKADTRQILIASGLAILSVAINPRGFYMFYHPYFLFTVVGSNHYTNELNSVFFRPEFFFSFKEPFIAFGAFLIGILGTVYLFIKSKLGVFKSIGSGYMVFAVATLYLGMTGYRNVIFTILVSLPLAIGLLLFITNKWEENTVKKTSTILAIGLLSLFYIGIGTNVYYDLFNTSNRYGLATYAESNPAGAAKFAKENGLADKRCFSDYLTSSYFLWNLRPGFESYIDLRDLDIFPKEFFETFIHITHFTNLFEESDAKYHYEYAMLYTWQFPNLHRYMYYSPDWQQVYADNVAAVYVKNNANNQAIIESYQLDSTDLGGNFNRTFQPEPSSFSNVISNLVWPFYSIRNEEVDSSLLASRYFRIVGDFDRADYHAQNTIANPETAYQGYAELGNIYLDIVPYKRTQQGQLEYLQMAQNAFSDGVKLDRTQWDCSYGLAMCSLHKGEYGYALKLFKKATKNDPGQIANYTSMAECYANLFQKNQSQKYLEQWFVNMEKAHHLDPENQSIISQLAIGYCQRNRCDDAAPLLQLYKRTADISEQNHNEIQACMKKCLR
tara:strand:- start:6650 stop:8932 length:2283 start_codon:yes stop_codon:yes gene_type:complete